MMPLLTLFLVVVIAAFIGMKKGIAGARVLLVIAAVGGIAAFAIHVWKGSLETPAQRRVTDQEAAGRVLAELVAREIPAGTVLVLRTPPSEKFKFEITLARFDGLQKALKKTPLQMIQVGPQVAQERCDDPAVTVLPEARFEPELVKWLGQHREIKAIISLLPVVPQLVGDKIPPLYGFFGGRGIPWVGAVRSGALKAVIISRKHAPPQIAEKNGLPPRFMLVTKDNLDAALKDQQF